jgi:hypothetical protein
VCATHKHGLCCSAKEGVLADYKGGRSLDALQDFARRLVRYSPLVCLYACTCFFQVWLCVLFLIVCLQVSVC